MRTDPKRPSTWVRYRSGLCAGCSSGCCTLPVEVSVSDLLRLELLSEDEAATLSPRKIAKKLLAIGVIQAFHASSGLYILTQKIGDACVFLSSERRCTVYSRRPQVCRAFPRIGPRPGFCPASSKKPLARPRKAQYNFEQGE